MDRLGFAVGRAQQVLMEKVQQIDGTVRSCRDRGCSDRDIAAMLSTADIRVIEYVRDSLHNTVMAGTTPDFGTELSTAQKLAALRAAPTSPEQALENALVAKTGTGGGGPLRRRLGGGKKEKGKVPGFVQKQVKSKWYRLLEGRARVDEMYRDLAHAGRGDQLLTLSLDLVTKELEHTEQAEVFKALLAHSTDTDTKDVVLDGFDIVGGKHPCIMWTNGDIMMNMMYLRLMGLEITRDDEAHFDIADRWDNSTEDVDIGRAWRDRAAKWPWESERLQTALAAAGYTSKNKPGAIRENFLRNLTGHVYCVQASRMISDHAALKLEEELMSEEMEIQEKQERKKTKATVRKQKKEAAKAAKVRALEDSEYVDTHWEAYMQARRKMCGRRLTKSKEAVAVALENLDANGVGQGDDGDGRADEETSFDELLRELKIDLAGYQGE